MLAAHRWPGPNVAVILCTCCGRSLPFDFIKTRMQKMDKGPDGKYPYAGPVDCAVKTFKTEVNLWDTSNPTPTFLTKGKEHLDCYRPARIAPLLLILLTQFPLVYAHSLCEVVQGSPAKQVPRAGKICSGRIAHGRPV